MKAKAALICKKQTGGFFVCRAKKGRQAAPLRVRQVLGGDRMYDPEIHHRRSIRLRKYDYASEGIYFVTICAHEKGCLFGAIHNGLFSLNEAGRRVAQMWWILPQRFPQVALDEFVVMPNHVHGIVCIVGALLAAPLSLAPPAAPRAAGLESKTGAASSAPTLGKIMRAFKSTAAIEVNRVLDRQGQPLWQRNYYERIIRTEKELTTIREYIVDNPARWAEDKENPNIT